MLLEDIFNAVQETELDIEATFLSSLNTIIINSEDSQQNNSVSFTPTKKTIRISFKTKESLICISTYNNNSFMDSFEVLINNTKDEKHNEQLVSDVVNYVEYTL